MYKCNKNKNIQINTTQKGKKSIQRVSMLLWSAITADHDDDDDEVNALFHIYSSRIFFSHFFCVHLLVPGMCQVGSRQTVNTYARCVDLFFRGCVFFSSFLHISI